MSIVFPKASLVVSPGQVIQLSQLVNVSASSSNPTYLVLNGYDRNEYTNSSSGATGSFSGNSRTLGFSALAGDVRGAGLVFTYAAATGRYSNPTYGFLDQLSYIASNSSGDITDLSVFGTSSASFANSHAANGISLAQYDAAGYLDTLTIVTESGYQGMVPLQATPLSIAAMAQTFDGLFWNTEGCWVLASTISAEAGASLPVQSAVNMAGAANGEWFIAYDGPAGSTGDWKSSVRAGDMIGFLTSAGTGHITTCVSGAGETAMLIDNITLVTSQGVIINSANDGSARDVIIQPAHPASQEWQGVMDKSVVIFRLDTPVVTTLSPTVNVSAGQSVNLSTLFSATDPAGKAITAYQAYTRAATDWFTVDGRSSIATSAATAVTAPSLSQITLNGGTPDMLDLITVRAFNGSYWGDWTTISTEYLSGNEVSIHRFFNTTDGTHFFTASATEAVSTATTRSDLVAEGVGLKGYDNPNASPSSEAVFRFFNKMDGTHFYTASVNERNALVTARSSEMAFEGIAFYENLTPQPGDTAVYRFFDTAHGTHLFTQNASERATILSTRPDLVSEGIAFYAPN